MFELRSTISFAAAILYLRQWSTSSTPPAASTPVSQVILYISHLSPTYLEYSCTSTQAPKHTSTIAIAIAISHLPYTHTHTHIHTHTYTHTHIYIYIHTLYIHSPFCLPLMSFPRWSRGASKFAITHGISAVIIYLDD